MQSKYNETAGKVAIKLKHLFRQGPSLYPHPFTDRHEILGIFKTRFADSVPCGRVFYRLSSKKNSS